MSDFEEYYLSAKSELDDSRFEIAELKRQLEEADETIKRFNTSPTVECLRQMVSNQAVLENEKLFNSLAESQAREVKLREALTRHQELTRPLDSTITALALPHDDTALNEYRDGVIEDCAKIAHNACLVPPDGGSPSPGEVAVCDEAARRIRELKAP